MKKKRKFIVIALLILLVPTLMYGINKLRTNERNIVEEKWGIELTDNIKVEELYSSIGFFGEGNRILKAVSKDDKYDGTALLNSTSDINQKRKQYMDNEIKRIVEDSKLKIDQIN